MLKIFLSIGAIQIVAILSSLIRTKYIAVTLGPEGTGIISIIDQVVQLTSYICALSLPLASIKYLSKANSESADTFKEAYASFLGLLLIISFASSIILFLLVYSQIDLPLGEINKYRNYLYIALLGIPAMMLGGFLSNVLASAGKPNSAATLTLIYSLALTIAILVGVSIAGISGFYLATVISGAIVTVGVLFYIKVKLHLPFFSRTRHPLTLLKEQPDIMKFAILLFFASVAHSYAFFVARYAILDNYGEAAAGLLHALLAIAISIDMVLSPINGFFLAPKVNRNIDNLEKIRFSLDFQKIQVLLMTVIVLPFVLYPNLTIYILFSEKFMAVAPYLFIFVLGQFLNQMGGVYQMLMIGFDNTKMFSFISVVSWLFFAAFSWLMVPLWGYLAVGIGFLISRVLVLFWSLAYLKFNYPIKIPTKTMLLSLYCLALISITGYFSSSFNDFDWQVFIGKGFLYIIMTAALYLFLSKSEKLSLVKQFRWLPFAKNSE